MHAGGLSLALLSGPWPGFLFELLLILCCQPVEAYVRAGCLPRIWGLGFDGELSGRHRSEPTAARDCVFDPLYRCLAAGPGSRVVALASDPQDT